MDKLRIRRRIKSELLDEIEKEVDSVKKEQKALKGVTAPLVQVDKIEADRSTPGEGEVIIGGVPVDVFDIEGMTIKVSPSDMKTVLRYDNARVIEQMRNTKRPKDLSLAGGGWGLIIIIAIIGGIAAFFLLFGEQIIGFFQGLFGGLI